MKKIWEYFDNALDIVYVADINTYELIFINQCGLSAFGYSKFDDIKGKKCYEILQNLTEPCPFCSNKYLKLNQFYKWTYKNPITNKTYTLNDTLFSEDNRLLRMEIAIDCTNESKKQNKIQSILHNEFITNECLQKMHSTNDAEESIHIALSYIGEKLQSDRAYIFEIVKNDPDYISNTYEWCKEGIEPQKDFLSLIPKTIVSSWFKKYEQNNNLIIYNIEDIKESDPQTYTTLKCQDIYSLITAPLIYNEEIIGFFGVDNPPIEKMLYIDSLFSVLSHFITSSLCRRDLINSLKNLSYHDTLTNALNRHALNSHYKPSAVFYNIGIAYCDVSGLKQINDTFGHHEGDIFLVKTYKLLTKIFSSSQIYRIGGDEFLIIEANIQKKDFEYKIQNLKKLIVKTPDFTIAIGYIWENVCSNIAKSINKADALMYKEKANYYKHQHKLFLNDKN